MRIATSTESIEENLLKVTFTNTNEVMKERTIKFETPRNKVTIDEVRYVKENDRKDLSYLKIYSGTMPLNFKEFNINGKGVFSIYIKYHYEENGRVVYNEKMVYTEI